MCSKCSHPCRTTRYNDGKHKVATHSATTNTPPPSRSGMQRTSNRVATITSQSTTDDLQQKRKKPEINVLRGLPANAPINISMDVRYNSTSPKNSYGCGQSASQAVGTAIEWQTDKHEILGFHMENKLCKLGSSLRNQGQNVSCTGHQGCTATIRVVDPMSEYEIGRQIGVSFAQQQVGLKFVATDGDAKAFNKIFNKICHPSQRLKMASGQGSHWLIESPTMFIYL